MAARIEFFPLHTELARSSTKKASPATKKKLSKSLEEVHKTGRKKDGSPAKYKKAKKEAKADKPGKSAKAADKAAKSDKVGKTDEKTGKTKKTETGKKTAGAKTKAKSKQEWGTGSAHEAQLIEMLGDQTHEVGDFKVFHYKKDKAAIVTDGKTTKFFKGPRARAAAKKYANALAGEHRDPKPARGKAAVKPTKQNPRGYPTTGSKLDPNSAVSKMRAAGVADEDIVDKIDSHTIAFTKALMEGKGTSLLVSGKPGTGKSFGITKTLGKENKGKTWDSISGGAVTPRALYEFLYRNRDNKVLLLDDVDAFKNLDMTNMLKGALDSGDDREVSWSSQGTQQKPKDLSDDEFYQKKDKEIDDLDHWDEREPEDGKKKPSKKPTWKPPAKFKFNSRVIFITNKPMKDILKDPHLGAVASRALGKVDYDFDDRLIMTKMRKTWKFTKPDAMPEEDRKKIFDMIEGSYKSGKISNISMRLLPNAIDMKSTSGMNFDDLQKLIDDGALF